MKTPEKPKEYPEEIITQINFFQNLIDSFVHNYKGSDDPHIKGVEYALKNTTASKNIFKIYEKFPELFSPATKILLDAYLENDEEIK